MSQEDELRKLVARVFDIPVSEVTDELGQKNLEDWDSLNHLFLISEVERELGIEFTTEEVLQITTYKDLREIVAKKN